MKWKLPRADLYRLAVIGAGLAVLAAAVVAAPVTAFTPELAVWLAVAVPLHWYLDRRAFAYAGLGAISLGCVVLLTTLLVWGLLPALLVGSTWLLQPIAWGRRFFNNSMYALTLAATWLAVGNEVAGRNGHLSLGTICISMLLFWLTNVTLVGVYRMIATATTVAAYVHGNVVPILTEYLFNVVLASLAALSLLDRNWPAAILTLVLLASRYSALEKAIQLRAQNELSVQSLIAAIEAKDPFTRGHSDRVAELSRRMAVAMGLPPARVVLVTNAARLHDVGKIGIPDGVLTKTGRLTAEEYGIVQTHAVLTERILGARSDWKELAAIASMHHEWFNGEGYPNGLQGGQIPPEARIIAVADAYDAMTTNRAYRPARAPHMALLEIQRCAGVQFDPDAVKLLSGLLQADGVLTVAVREEQSA